MKKFAKISAVLAAMALAFSFAGCSDGSSGGGSDSSEITGGETSGGETSGGGTSSGGSGRDENGQLIVYSITYNLDGGKNAIGNPTNYTIETETVTLKEATKDGFVFLGWYTDSEFENKITEIAKGSTGEKTLYAQWWNSTDFVKVPAVSIKGSGSWTLKSEVFIDGRQLDIGAFYMCDHEVTQKEWEAVMEKLPDIGMAPAVGNADNNPVNYVSWYDAILYCNNRSIKERLTPCYTVNGSTDSDKLRSEDVTCDWNANGYRLPTEAEWEWAARGGENYKYAGSDTLDEVAWCYKNMQDLGTKEVKSKMANGYGLYDMTGNVYEWCWDWYDNISSNTLATGASSGSSRVMRGGGWGSKDEWCVVVDRSDNSPDRCSSNLGIRLVRSCD